MVSKSLDATFGLVSIIALLLSEMILVSQYSPLQLNYDEDDARETLDSDWLCKFVFSGVSEVNCWNKSQVGEYRLNIYE